MLRVIRELEGYTIKATDGDIGRVVDFYFDDQNWSVRYLVADTGSWLPGKQVLISPVAFEGTPDWGTRRFPVILNRYLVKECPDVNTHKPISRQKELEIAKYYKWPVYWQPASGQEEHPQVASVEVAEDIYEEEADTHLRSVREVIGYHIHAKDGDIGHVEDLIVDDQTWRIRYCVIDTRNWLPGKRVIISPQWIEDVSWDQAKVFVDLNKQLVKNSPEFNPSEPVNREYEARLFDYYGRPAYW